jgi:hypothetical protein
VQRLFAQKKNQLVAATTHITILIGNARMFVNLREKNSKFLMRFSWAPRSTLRVRAFLPEFFFITERKKTQYCDLLYDFFYF